VAREPPPALHACSAAPSAVFAQSPKSVIGPTHAFDVAAGAKRSGGGADDVHFTPLRLSADNLLDDAAYDSDAMSEDEARDTAASRRPTFEAEHDQMVLAAAVAKVVEAPPERSRSRIPEQTAQPVVRAGV
jgi:hypothetical protein